MASGEPNDPRQLTPSASSRYDWLQCTDKRAAICAVISVRNSSASEEIGGLALHPARIVIDAGDIFAAVFSLHDQAHFHEEKKAGRTSLVLYTKQAAAVGPGLSETWGKLECIRA